MKYHDRKAPIIGRRLIGFSIVMVVLFLSAIVYTWYTISAPGGPGAKVSLTIPPGASGNQVAKLLSEKQVISNVAVFKAYVKFGHSYEAKSGLYTFQKNESFAKVVAQLKNGPTIKLLKLTIPEGFRLQQIADRIAARIPGRSASAFLAVAKSGRFENSLIAKGTTDLQGYLFPDTYFVAENATDEQIIQMMLDRFEEQATALDLKSLAAQLGFTPKEIVTIASLIEKEVKRDEERELASGVIHNRLKIGMPLQLDSTSTYVTQSFDRPTLLSDREVDSPYNTFKVKGLPPGPIAAPGAAAIDAALHPTGDNIYFVTINDCTGETVFTKTLSEFNAAVNRRTNENPKTCTSAAAGN